MSAPITYTLRSRVVYNEKDAESVSYFISEYNELLQEYNNTHYGFEGILAPFKLNSTSNVINNCIQKQRKVIGFLIGDICMSTGEHYREYTDDRLVNEEIYTERVNILNFGIDLIDLINRYSHLFVTQIRKLNKAKKYLLASKREINKSYDDVQIRLDIEQFMW
jgi:hypothetical protein